MLYLPPVMGRYLANGNRLPEFGLASPVGAFTFKDQLPIQCNAIGAGTVVTLGQDQRLHYLNSELLVCRPRRRFHLRTVLHSRRDLLHFAASTYQPEAVRRLPRRSPQYSGGLRCVARPGTVVLPFLRALHQL